MSSSVGKAPYYYFYYYYNIWTAHKFKQAGVSGAVQQLHCSNVNSLNHIQSLEVKWPHPVWWWNSRWRVSLQEITEDRSHGGSWWWHEWLKSACADYLSWPKCGQSWMWHTVQGCVRTEWLAGPDFPMWRPINGWAKYCRPHSLPSSTIMFIFWGVI